MKNMTIGKQIGLGFSALLLITLILGGLGVFNMRSASSNADRMADVYVPEVKVGADVFRVAKNIRYAIRAFTMADNEEALASAKKDFVELQKLLTQAKELASKYELKKLEEYEDQATRSLGEYIESVERSEKILVNKKRYDTAMVDSASIFMQNANDFLHSQEEALDKEIDAKVEGAKLKERSHKISLINDVIDTGNTVRISGQRAQVKNDMKMMEDAIVKFKDVHAILEALRANSRQAINISQLKKIEDSAKLYEDALKGMIVVMHETAKENTLRIKLAAEVVGAAEKTVNIGVENTSDLANKSSDGLQQASTLMLTGLAIAMILGIILAIFIIKNIVKVITASVQKISEGTTQVVSASDQISSASVSLAEGASSQASSVEEVSATIEQATASNTQNAENSREANILAQNSNSAAKIGNQKV